MKKLFYFIIILIFGACSVTTDEDSTTSSVRQVMGLPAPVRTRLLERQNLEV